MTLVLSRMKNRYFKEIDWRLQSYSICITHRNNKPTLKLSLDSILNQIDDRFEVIVVDSLSSDGSSEILREYARSGKIKLIEKKCSRGKGIQIGFENSSGKYIISNLDMEDIFNPCLLSLLREYHSKSEGKTPLGDNVRSSGFSESRVRYCCSPHFGCRFRGLDGLAIWRGLGSREQSGEKWPLCLDWVPVISKRRFAP